MKNESSDRVERVALALAVPVVILHLTGASPTYHLELIVMTGFVIAAVVGFKSNAWIVVAGLAGHGGFDTFTPRSWRTQAYQLGGQLFVSRTTSERQVASPGL